MERGRVVHDRHGQPVEGGEGQSEPLGGPVGDDDHLDPAVAAHRRLVGAADPPVDLDVAVGHDLPPAVRGDAADPPRATARAARRHRGSGPAPRAGRRGRRAGPAAGPTDHVGEGATVAGDDRNAVGHRLDRDPAELLDPAGGRARRHREDVEARVERGERLVLDRTEEPDPSGQVRRDARSRSAASAGPAPATTSSVSGRPATASRSTSTPLWSASRPAYPIVRPRAGSPRGVVAATRPPGEPHRAARGNPVAGRSRRPRCCRRSPRPPRRGRAAAATGTEPGAACRGSGQSRRGRASAARRRARSSSISAVARANGSSWRSRTSHAPRRAPATADGGRRGTVPDANRRADALHGLGRNGGSRRTRAPPSSHALAASRRTSTPRRATARSRSRQASTTALCETRSTRTAVSFEAASGVGRGEASGAPPMVTIGAVCAGCIWEDVTSSVPEPQERPACSSGIFCGSPCSLEDHRRLRAHRARGDGGLHADPHPSFTATARVFFSATSPPDSTSPDAGRRRHHQPGPPHLHRGVGLARRADPLRSHPGPPAAAALNLSPRSRPRPPSWTSPPSTDAG